MGGGGVAGGDFHSVVVTGALDRRGDSGAAKAAEIVVTTQPVAGAVSLEAIDGQTRVVTTSELRSGGNTWTVDKLASEKSLHMFHCFQR